MTQDTPRFDDSLPRLAQALIGVLGADAVQTGQFLRNANGQLAFISAESMQEAQTAAAQTAAETAIGRYARTHSAVLQPTQPGLASLRQQARAYSEQLALDSGATLQVSVLEQRIVGQDWLHAPVGRVTTTPPSLHVFFSIKGGVGRSTALAVSAAELARQGRKVLVIDLDLEAPGLGHMLLTPEELPRYGLLDAHVESHAGALDDEFLFDMMSASPFGKGQGLIDVVPAVGTLAQRHPANVLAKIARAYLESFDEEGRTLSFLDRTRQITDRLTSLKRYDAVLIDARAGLNESTAAALLGLEAQVLLFGENTPQTFAGYRYLLAHLARFDRPADDDWLDRFHMVHAKASADAAEQQVFRDRAHTIFQEWLYKDVPLDDSQADTVTLPEYSVDDPEAPHHAWPVLRDSNYVEFNPLAKPSELMPDLYARTYGALLQQFHP